MPTGIYKRTEYHKAILRNNGFKLGEKKPLRTEEHKEKLSVSLKGNIPWNKGKKGLQINPMKGQSLPKEWREKLSIARLKIRDSISGENHPRWKGGYKNTLFYNRQRVVNKKTNKGSHTLQEWEDLKFKYDYMCLCCKKQVPEIKLTEDHVIPLSKGGSNYIDNIQPLCQRCNSLKWTKVLDFRLVEQV